MNMEVHGDKNDVLQNVKMTDDEDDGPEAPFDMQTLNKQSAFTTSGIGWMASHERASHPIRPNHREREVEEDHIVVGVMQTKILAVPV